MPTSPRLLAAAFMLLPALASSQTLPPPEHRQLARAILEELVEINTVRDSGATRAATALAKRLTGGGFPPEDVHLVGPKPHKQNLVVRLRGRGKGKPILFLAHLDVVEARRASGMGTSTAAARWTSRMKRRTSSPIFSA